MSHTCKSPIRVIELAYALAKHKLPDHFSKFSRKTYTVPQLFACLILKTFYNRDYRGVEAMLKDWSDLRKIIELNAVPDHTTLCRAAKRLLNLSLTKQLILTLNQAFFHKHQQACVAAIDSTGFESTRISPYFVRRRARGTSHYENTTYTRWPKLGIIAEIKSHMIMAVDPSVGPMPDVGQWKRLMHRQCAGTDISVLLADAGYDSEANHELLRQKYGLFSIIPARHGRPSHRWAKGKHRRLMQRMWQEGPPEIYGQRWQVETVFSMMKQNLGQDIRGRSYHSRNRQMMLKCITHNLMV